MSKLSSGSAEEKQMSRTVIDISIKLTVLAFIWVYCFEIIRPFALLVIWGGILAISLFPIYKKLTALVGGKKSVASIIIAVIGIAIIVVPSVQLSS